MEVVWEKDWSSKLMPATGINKKEARQTKKMH